MADRPARPLARAAGWLALAYVLAFFARALWVATSTGAWSELLVGLPAILWLSIPVVVAAGFVGASPTRAGATAFLWLEIALILSLVGFLIVYRGHGAIIGLFFFPVVQFGAIALIFLVALRFGWRMRPDFLKD